MTPDQRKLRAEIGGLTRAAMTDMKALGYRGYEARRRRLADKIDPQHQLNDNDREIKVDLLIAAQNKRAALVHSTNAAKRRKNVVPLRRKA